MFLSIIFSIDLGLLSQAIDNLDTRISAFGTAASSALECLNTDFPSKKTWNTCSNLVKVGHMIQNPALILFMVHELLRSCFLDKWCIFWTMIAQSKRLVAERHKRTWRRPGSELQFLGKSCGLNLKWKAAVRYNCITYWVVMDLNMLKHLFFSTESTLRYQQDCNVYNCRRNKSESAQTLLHSEAVIDTIELLQYCPVSWAYVHVVDIRFVSIFNLILYYSVCSMLGIK